MDVTFNVDFNVLNLQMAKLAAAAKVDGALVVKEEAKQFVITVGGQSSGMSGLTPPKTFRQGLDRVDRSLNRVASPMTASVVSRLVGSNPRLQKRVRQLLGVVVDTPGFNFVGQQFVEYRIDAEIALRAIFKNLPKMSRWQKLNESDFSRTHRAAQNQNGVVPRKLYNYTFEVAKWKQYVESIRSHIGILKSGWSAAANGLGVVQQPWVARHGTRYSRYNPDLNNASGAIITMTNSGVKLPDYGERIEAALAYREQAIGTKVARLMAGKATNLGFTTIEAQ